MLLKNNLIAVAIHVGICLVSLLFFSTIGILIFMFLSMLATVIFTILAFYLYLRVGKRFLSDTNNVLTNTLSVTALATILVVATSISGPEGIIVNYSFAPLGGTLYIFDPVVKKEVSILVMAILPSLAMWIGVTTKRLDDDNSSGIENGSFD
jgi:hypothetical protein